MGSACRSSRNRILQRASAVSAFLSLSLSLSSFVAKYYYRDQTKGVAWVKHVGQVKNA